jgi:uncharacterized membrane protein YfcA
MANVSEIALVSFITSFLFALGGLGSAVALIPILVFLGVPFNLARPTGLFTNFFSTFSATVHNLKERLIDFKMAFPIIAFSIITAPIGAYASHFVPEKIVAIAFTCFLFFAGTMVYMPKREVFKEKNPILISSLTGGLAGFVSGFLGVGGGGIISPLLIAFGFNPKKVAPVTAFSVLFSSFIAFITYAKLGSVDWSITLSAAIPAGVAGYLAAYVGHKLLNPKQIKRILGMLFFILGIKFLLKFF